MTTASCSHRDPISIAADISATTDLLVANKFDFFEVTFICHIKYNKQGICVIT